LAAVLLVAAALLGLEAVGDSVTIDEFAHLPAGLYYLRTGRFDVYNLSPPLLREIAALPLLAAHPEGDVAAFGGTPVSQHWALGYAFMERNAARYHRLFVLGRLPMAALTLVLVLAVGRCGTQLLGPPAGLAAATLTAFSPTVLAHGHLVGTDVGCALAILLASWAALLALRAPSVRRTAVLGLALGAAVLTKFSALALYPTLAVLALVASLGQPAARWRPWAAVVGAAVASLLVINAGYLGEGFGQPLATYALRDPTLERLAAGPLGRLPLPLPADFVRGYDTQHVEASGLYPVYFHGTWSTHGWWWYFPAALGLKETLPLLGLGAVGLLLLVTRRVRLEPLVAAFLVVPPLVFASLLILFTDIDLGVRYLLPALPFLCLIAAVPLAPGVLPAFGRRIAAALVALHAAVSLAATPAHLAYTNLLAGPADGAWRWLADSNLDWGQELRRLHAYLAVRGLPTIRLAYFGRVAPEVYDIPYELARGPLRPGLYVVSASFLAGRPYFLYDHGQVYEAPPDAFAAFRRLTPTAVIGHSLFIYDLRR
jgi:4-amino-4-deoxy-L-arabinose transferase-like glycosyltransferase